jgi:hypothetical protein
VAAKNKCERKIKMIQIKEWIYIIAALATILDFLLGFFIGKKSGIKLMQEQQQQDESKKQYQKQSIKL